MDVEFDPAKDAANIAKHGVSLPRFADLVVQVSFVDLRYTNEVRFLAFGLLDDLPHVAAFTMRGSVFRVISLRRAHLREYRRHVR